MIMFKEFWRIYLFKIIAITMLLIILKIFYKGMNKFFEENFSSEVIVEEIKIIKRIIAFILVVFFLVISYMIMKDSDKLKEEKERRYRYEKFIVKPREEAKKKQDEEERLKRAEEEISEMKKQEEKNFEIKYDGYFKTGENTVIIEETNVETQRKIIRIAEKNGYKLINISQGRNYFNFKVATMIFEKEK